MISLKYVKAVWPGGNDRGNLQCPRYHLFIYSGWHLFILTKTNISTTQQKCFVRVVMSQGYSESSGTLFLSLKVLPRTHLFVFKVLQNLFVSSRKITENEWIRKLKNPRLLSVLKPKKIFSKSIILFLVLTIINKMPEKLKNIVSMHSLNREAKQLVAVLGKLCCWGCIEYKKNNFLFM